MSSKRNILVLVFLIALSAGVFAQASYLDVTLPKGNYYARSGSDVVLSFNFTNLYDGADDGDIDLADLYLLDVSDHDITLSSWNGPDWGYEHIAQYNDDHFSIADAVNQTLNVTLHIDADHPETREDMVGYLQFSDDEGATTGLGDNQTLLPLDDDATHIYARISVDNSPPVISNEYFETPMFLMDGFEVSAEITDTSPITDAFLEYYYPGRGINEIDLISPNPYHATIPVSDLVEGQTMLYRFNATDAAGNTVVGDILSTVLNDNPQISNYGPDTTMPDTPITLSATIIDFSGIDHVNFSYSLNGVPRSDELMVQGAGNQWAIDLGALSEGTTVSYTITAYDAVGNSSSVSSSFSVLSAYPVTFTVRDAVTNELLNGVILDVSGSGPVQPATYTVDGTINFQQTEGTYDFTFTLAGYNPLTVRRTVNQPINETILLGAPSSLAVGEVFMIPYVVPGERAFYIEVVANVTDTRYGVQDVSLRYGFNSIILDQIFQLSYNETTGLYSGAMGPYTGEITLFPRLEALGEDSTLIIVNLGERWYSLIELEGFGELCNGIDDNNDGEIDEKLSMLCGNTDIGACTYGVRTCFEGQWGSCTAVEPISEICGNDADDDCDGSIDEGCPCAEGDVRGCGIDAGICNAGTQTCYLREWTECRGDYNPGLEEVCGNGLDDDCDGRREEGCMVDSDGDGLLDDEETTIYHTDPFDPDTDNDQLSDGAEVLKYDTIPFLPDTDGDLVSDGQEVLFDGTDPKDPNSNLLSVVIFSDILSAGDSQKITVEHPELGQIPKISADITYPGGTEKAVADNFGVIGFRVLDKGRYNVILTRENYRGSAAFEVVAYQITVERLTSDVAKIIFGESVSEAPINGIILLILCIIVGVLAFKRSEMFFEGQKKSTNQIKKERYLRVLIGILFFLLPVVASNLFGVEIGIVLALLELILLFMSDLIKKQLQKRQIIKV
ncbi:MAG: MopE-related protein [Candidatus Diapherotrites archaeon]